MTLIYKIRHNETGLFSTGGGNPDWTKRGKTWINRGGITSHLNLVKPSRWRHLPYPYVDATVIAFELIEIEDVDSHVPANDWKPKQSTIRANELAEERHTKRTAEWETEELQRLEREADALRIKLRKV